MNKYFTPNELPTATEEISPGSVTIPYALARIATWIDLSPTRQRDLASSLKSVGWQCRHYDLQQASENPPGPLEKQQQADKRERLPPILLTCSYLRPRLVNANGATFHRSERRQANITSDLRYVMRRLGTHAPSHHEAAPLLPEWEVLLPSLPGKYRRFAVVGLVRFCSRHGIMPQQVTSATLADYEVWRSENTLAEDPADNARGALATWNWARGRIAGWPDTELDRPGLRKRYVFPQETYLPSVRDDMDRFERRIAGTDPEDFFSEGSLDNQPMRGSRSHQPASDATVKTRRFQALQSLAALVHAGHSPESLLSLEILVNPVGNAKTILTFFHERSGRKPSAQNGGIAEFLRQVAKYHHPQPVETIALISKWGRKVAKNYGGKMTPKNRHRLRALTNARTWANLMHLPRHLMTSAAEPDRSRSHRDHLAMSAAVYEILIICPLRMKNLWSLRVDRHLQGDDPRSGRITHLIIPEEQTKNGVAIEWPIPPESAALLRDYIDHYRATLGRADSPFLFPGTNGGARSESAVRHAVTATARRYLGVRLNPHLMRAFAAWSYLRDNPGDYETVRRVLGHKDIRTTIAYYTGIEAEFAAAKFDATVLRARRKTRATAASAFKPHRPKRPRK